MLGMVMLSMRYCVVLVLLEVRNVLVDGNVFIVKLNFCNRFGSDLCIDLLLLIMDMSRCWFIKGVFWCCWILILYCLLIFLCWCCVCMVV